MQIAGGVSAASNLPGSRRQSQSMALVSRRQSRFGLGGAGKNLAMHATIEEEEEHVIETGDGAVGDEAMPKKKPVAKKEVKWFEKRRVSIFGQRVGE